MFSQTVKYALRILSFLLEHRKEWVQGEQIASATGLPANYLSKVLSQLRKHDIVRSQKGWGGGFQLPESSISIPVARVVELFDGSRTSRQCIFGLPKCDPKHPCPLHYQWEQISGSYDTMLEATTIGDLGRASGEAVPKGLTGRPSPLR